MTCCQYTTRLHANAICTFFREDTVSSSHKRRDKVSSLVMSYYADNDGLYPGRPIPVALIQCCWLAQYYHYRSRQVYATFTLNIGPVVRILRVSK